MALYHELAAIDVIDPILHLRQSIPATNPKIMLDSAINLPHPWIHSGERKDRNCGRFTFYFNNYKFIPRNCRLCWKITFHPRTLKEAFDTIDLQRKQGFSAKVGMEKRDYTQCKGGYSAFWYCPLGCGLDRARARFEEVRKFVDEGLGRETGMILKRGCTEFERHFGASDGWDALARKEGWDRKEDLLDAVFEDDGYWKHAHHPSFVEVNTRLHMIHWAFESHKLTGDETFKEYVGGDVLPPLLTYHNSIHSEKDFPEVWNEQDHLREFPGPEEAAAEVEAGSSVPGNGRIITEI
jgi:hypothetical protein